MRLGIHGVNITEAVQCSDAAKQSRLINKSREKILTLNEKAITWPANNTGVFTGGHAGNNVVVLQWLQISQSLLQCFAGYFSTAASTAWRRIDGGLSWRWPRRQVDKLIHKLAINTILPAPHPRPLHGKAATATGGITATGCQQG